MKRILLLLFLSSSFINGHSLQKIKLQTGDLLFVDLDCGPLCDAIESVTESYQNQHFSHIGLVLTRNDSIFLIEAMGKAVRLVPLSKFLSATAKPVFAGRLKKEHQNLIPKAIAFSIKQLGVPYDDEFLYNNRKYYCSELIYDAFLSANENKPFFSLFPMKYKKPGSDSYDPAWVEYFRKLNTEIPEGKPGCNPGGISLSSNIEMLGTL